MMAAKKKPGKYAGVVDGLRPLSSVKTPRQERIDALKEEILAGAPRLSGWSAGELATEYRRARREKEWAETGKGGEAPWLAHVALRLATADLKDYQRVLSEAIRPASELGMILDAYEQLLVDQYKVEGVMSTRSAVDGATVSVRKEPHATVKDREGFRKWCVDNGLETQLQLPWSTTNALLKRLLLAGQAEPDGIESFNKDTIILRAGKMAGGDGDDDVEGDLEEIGASFEAD